MIGRPITHTPPKPRVVEGSGYEWPLEVKQTTPRKVEVGDVVYLTAPVGVDGEQVEASFRVTDVDETGRNATMVWLGE